MMPKWGHAISAAGLSVAVFACAGTTNGAASDMPLFGGDPTPQTPVEFGTGWYIRGSVGGTFDKGPVLDSTGSFLDNAIKSNWSAELGAGYKFNNWFRGDLTLGTFGPQSANAVQSGINCYSGIENVTDQTTGDSIGVYAIPNQCNANQQASLRKYLLLTNAYVDLGTWYGVTPFVGAGAGVARIQQNGSVTYTNASDGSPYSADLVLPSTVANPTFLQGPALTTALNPQPNINYGTQNWNRYYTTVKYNFAWALMAGASYNLTENAALELGYRYVNFGSYTGINSTTGATFSKNLSSQEIRIGVRYLVD